MSDQIGRDVTTHVYQLFDGAGGLLYTGIATDVKRRLAEHRMSKNWYSEVARVDTATYSCRWRAALAELSSGRGKYGVIGGGIGRKMAASMTDDELAEASRHRVYSRLTDVSLARHWGISVSAIRHIRSS